MELYSEDVLEPNIHHTWWKKEKESKSTEKYFKDDKGEYWTRCMVVARQAAAVAAQCNSKKGKKRKREAALKGKMQDFSILVSNIFDECDEPDSEAEEISDVDSDFDELEE